MRFSGKKILYITHNYNYFIKDQIELISPRFDKVYVLVRTKPVAELDNYLPIPRLEPFKRKNLIDDNSLPGNVEVIPIPLYYLPFDSSYKKLGRKHYRAVAREIRKRGVTFDLIHAHFTWTAGYVGMRLSEESGKPFIVTAHGYDIYDLPFRDDVWRKSIRAVLQSSDHVITVSEKNRECIQKLEVSTPVSVIPNGFREDLFYPRDTMECRALLGLPPDRKIFLNVGALMDVKGQVHLIEAVGRLREASPDVLCVIVGSGELRNILARLIREKGLKHHVVLVGSRPHKEIPLWINACDVFVLPSLAEGNPTVMFECLGCGKPFVGSSVGGIPDVITSGSYGLIANPSDAGDLAGKLQKAIALPWDSKTISAYAESFKWESITGSIISTYETTLN